MGRAQKAVGSGVGKTHKARSEAYFLNVSIWASDLPSLS